MKLTVQYTALLFSLLLAACGKDFLDVPPKNNPVRSEYVTNLASCQEYLTGIYVDFSTNITTKYYPIYSDLVSDNLKPSATAFWALYNWQQLETEESAFSSSTSNINGFWRAAYGVVRNVNYLLENIDKYRGEGESKADNIKGQALVLRAYLHYLLLNIYAQSPNATPAADHPGVPYITSSDYTEPVSGRSTVAQCYSSIVTDITQGIGVLAESAPNKLVIAKTTAKGLLARIYLQRGEYALSKNYASEVAAAVPLVASASYPASLFRAQDKEALWQIPPSVTATGNYTTAFPSNVLKRTGEFVATIDIVEAINENPLDARRKWFTKVSSNWRVWKFPSGVVSGITDTTNSYYHTIIRSSEMFLTAAEAYARLGNSDSARWYLDEIRKRADPTALASTAEGAPLVDSILKERRKELCFEGFRCEDLKRAGKPVTRIDVATSAQKTLPFGDPKAIAPLPLVDVRTYGLKQNGGY